jgi:hypothetical protein
MFSLAAAAVVTRPAVAAVVITATRPALGPAAVRGEVNGFAAEGFSARLAALASAFACLAQGTAALAEVVVAAGPGATVAVNIAVLTIEHAAGATDARGRYVAVCAAVRRSLAGATRIVAARPALAASKAAAVAVVTARFACLVTTAFILGLASGVAVGRQDRA